MAKLTIPTDLEQDHNTLIKILSRHGAVATDTMPDDLRFLWKTYLVILESALSALEALMAYRKGHPSNHQ